MPWLGNRSRKTKSYLLEIKTASSDAVFFHVQFRLPIELLNNMRITAAAKDDVAP